MHATEKILARAGGKSRVETGEIVTARIDLAGVNDIYPQVIRSFWDLGGKRVWDRDRVAFMFDHFAPAPSVRAADTQAFERRFVREQDLRWVFEINEGICHQILPENGLVRPGMVVVETDSHTTTLGAFACFATGLGATDMGAVLATGETWFRVPPVFRVVLDGELGPCTGGKDLALLVMERLGQDGVIYEVLEYAGEAVEMLGVDDRMTMCNLAVEMGAKTAYVAPNEEVLDFVRRHAFNPSPFDGIEEAKTDPGYRYAREVVFPVRNLEPLLARPGKMDDVVSVRAVEGVPIDQGFIGSCTGGRLSDLKVAAEILRGRHVAPHCRLVVVPASRQTLQEAMARGYIQDLVAAGAALGTPGCAGCSGLLGGLLGEGEVCISAANRNYPGRMGNPKAQIYLGSAATVAASVVEGKIADPRRYLG